MGHNLRIVKFSKERTARHFFADLAAKTESGAVEKERKCILMHIGLKKKMDIASGKSHARKN
jgi:hypothetical protein